jgi:hypothetical protein
VNTILKHLSNAHLEAWLTLTPDDTGAVEELLVRFRELLDTTAEQEPLVAALKNARLDSVNAIENAARDRRALDMLLYDYRCYDTTEVRKLLDKNNKIVDVLSSEYGCDTVEEIRALLDTAGEHDSQTLNLLLDYGCDTVAELRDLLDKTNME